LPIPHVLVVSEDVKQGKPAPEGYRLGAARLGYDPEDCLVFEDAPAGVAAGRAAGARVLALTTTYAPPNLREANGAIPDFTGIRVHRAGDAFVVVAP
jgi:sugar-phosphatase